MADFFGYNPMRVDFIFVVPPKMAERLINRWEEGSKTFERIEVLHVRRKVPHTPTTEIVVIDAVMMVQYNQEALKRLRMVGHDEIDALPTRDRYQTFSIIKLTNKYPEYLKDREKNVTALTMNDAVQVFNADINNWLKNAV